MVILTAAFSLMFVPWCCCSGTLTVVADFGCGDAKIARTVSNVVHSFDLVALNEHVTACDMAHVSHLNTSSLFEVTMCLLLLSITFMFIM